MADNITQVLQDLDLIDSSYDRRRKIEALAEENLFSVTATAKEIERNYSYVRVDGYRDGYALLGTVQGVASEVKILLPATMSDQATGWSVGEEKSFIVKIYDWDSAYKHFKLLATELVSAQPEPSDPTPEESTPSATPPEQAPEAESASNEEVGEQSPIPPPAEPDTGRQPAPSAEPAITEPESTQAPFTEPEPLQTEEIDDLRSIQQPLEPIAETQPASPLELTDSEAEQFEPPPAEPAPPVEAPEPSTEFLTSLEGEESDDQIIEAPEPPRSFLKSLGPPTTFLTSLEGEEAENQLELPDPEPPVTEASTTIPPAPEPPPVVPPAAPSPFQQRPIQLSRYAPPTLSKVPIIERVQTFGGRTKPMSPLVGSQRFSHQPVNPFEIVQGEFRKPFILGLKIFGGIFAAFLLLTCICCGILSR